MAEALTPGPYAFRLGGGTAAPERSNENEDPVCRHRRFRRAHDRLADWRHAADDSAGCYNGSAYMIDGQQ
jgi:hypothetical protein